MIRRRRRKTGKRETVVLKRIDPRDLWLVSVKRNVRREKKRRASAGE